MKVSHSSSQSWKNPTDGKCMLMTFSVQYIHSVCHCIITVKFLCILGPTNVTVKYLWNLTMWHYCYFLLAAYKVHFLTPVRTSHRALLAHCCSLRELCPGIRESGEQCSCCAGALRDWCAVPLSSGVDPAWALRRRTGALGLHSQLFLMSEESLRIMGLPGIYATVQWMCMLPT